MKLPPNPSLQRTTNATLDTPGWSATGHRHPGGPLENVQNSLDHKGRLGIVFLGLSPMTRQKKHLEKDLQDIYKEAPIGLCSLDTNLCYIHINDWLAALNGLPVEAHLERTIREVLPEVPAGVEHQLRNVIETGEPLIDGQVEAETPAQPGVVRTFQHSYYPNRSEDGKIMGVGCVVVEITERKRAEAALRDSEIKFRSVTESAIEGIVLADSGGNIILLNKAAQTIFRYTDEEVLGKPLTVLMPERYREAHRKGLERMRTMGKTQVVGKTLELHGRRKDGVEFPLELALATWRSGEESFYSGMIRDITDRKRAEEELRRAHDELEARVAERTSIITEANRQLEAEITERKGAKVALQQAHDELEARVLRRTANLAEANRGLEAEITHRKEVEESLRKLNQHHQLILTSAGGGIYGLDLQGNTTFINPAAAKMVGYEPDEVIGKSQHAILHHSRPDGSPYPREECPIHTAFRDGTIHHVDTEVFWRKDGTWFPVEYTSVPVHDEQGKLVGAMVTFRDISCRKASSGG